MKHASATTLEKLTTVLERIRHFDCLRERRPGIFYHRSRAFLHFHEHGEEIFADLRLEEDFERLPCTTEADRDALITSIGNRFR